MPTCTSYKDNGFEQNKQLSSKNTWFGVIPLLIGPWLSCVKCMLAAKELKLSYSINFNFSLKKFDNMYQEKDIRVE